MVLMWHAFLGIPEVIIPPYPGITSAFGPLLPTDLKYDAIRTEFQISDQVDADRLTRDFYRMETELAVQFKQDGLQPSDITYHRSGDLRYVGQGYELRVPFTTGNVERPAFPMFSKYSRASICRSTDIFLKKPD
ncbi:MAG: hypothetical protein CM1200mP41_37520 [Gammaproteobacteria bacterium]|nr:MAG: hypothetical protein CM1200mP41_37520 [Gammaproteobacteria bacterium]